MTLAATGLYSLPVHYGRLTLAASATFRDLVGAADADAALAKIHHGEIDEDNPLLGMPRCLLNVTGEMEGEKVSTTGFLHKGQLELVIEVETPEAYKGPAGRRDARTWFQNAIGAIASEIEALAGQGGYLNILKWNDKNCGRADPKDNNGKEYYVAVIYWDWQG